jgi:8-oxo-dGTP diphosphatase
MIPRFGDGPDLTQRYRHRAGAYAILLREGQVLCTFQEDPQPEVQLPGGGIDPGESPIRALHREVMEETGWRISTPLKLGTYRRFTYMPEYGIHAEKVCHVYFAQPIRQISAPSEAGHSAVWLDASVAAKWLASPGDAAFMRGLMA